MASGGEEAFLKERQMIRLGIPPNRVDIHNFGPEIPFDQAWARPKDLRDLEELGEI